MSTIAFIGLGIMGSPMAVHLAKAGHQVVGYNRSPQRTAALVEAGGTAADSIAKAVAGADVVAVMVPDSPDVQAVLAGENGVFDNAPAGALIIDFSSIRPDITTALAAQAVERGFRLIDAPVSGGEAGAVNAALSIMVGGTPEDFESAKPILDVVGKTVVHVGPNGSGQTVKAANQLIVAGNIQLLAEAIVFLEAYGVDTKAAVEVLGGARRLGGPESEGTEDAGPVLRPRIPDRVAPQGPWHRDRRGPRGRCGGATRRRRRPTDGLRASEWRWWA